MSSRPTLSTISDAYQRISGYVHQTPIMTSSALEKLSAENAGLNPGEIQLFFKCENLQKTGAFKARGACNAILLEKAKHEHEDGHQHGAEKFSGVVTHSSGNHGQAVAWAASQARVPCSVVVPKITPQVKCDAIQGYGAELTLCEKPTDRKDVCDKIARETGKTIIHPYDNYDVIAGQGTIAYEMMEVQGLKDLDAILVPISGGGMTAGIAIAAKAINPNIKVIAVEPVGKELSPCLKSGDRLWPNPPQFLNTIAEGIMTQQAGQLTFPILCDLIEKETITITDEEMIRGMKIVAERMKLIIEASAGASAAAAIYRSKEILEKFPEVRKIGVVLCGGNVDIEKLPWTK